MKRRGIALFVVLVFTLLTGCSGGVSRTDAKSVKAFRLLASTENREIEPLLMDAAKALTIDLAIEYAGTQEILRRLEKNAADYDACWLANSFWGYMLNPSPISAAKPVSINPVIFGVRQSVARSLGWDQECPSLDAIVAAVGAGKLRFLMPSPTQTNAGASAYLGFLSSLCGNPQVLTGEMLAEASLQEKLTTLFAGVERSAGDEESIGRFFEAGEYDALVDYESSLLSLNVRLTAADREPVILLYPADGVSLADSPFGYIDHGDASKQAQFEKLQSYLLSTPAQDALLRLGRRANYGGLIPAGYGEVFRPEWGVQADAYLSPVTVPAAEVIREAFTLYQETLRKPSLVVFCLDFSGSMSGRGHEELSAAMEFLLTPSLASADLLQFTGKDIVAMIPFTSFSLDIAADRGDGAEALLAKYREWEPGGGTDIYGAGIAALEAVEQLRGVAEEANPSIVLMTDGRSTTGTRSEFLRKYAEAGQGVPIYSITFGDADPAQLEELAKLSNAMVFDGTKDLASAFRVVRGFQ